jgi:glutamate-1-semialdehyde 2,1-aminomutase
MNTERSRSLQQQSETRIPGGVDSPVRAFRAVGGQPRWFERGEGAWLTDVDGNRYLDYIGSWGAMLLGHAHPRVVRAVQEAAARGLSFGASSPAELRLAETVQAAFPQMERLRFVNSGTEATMSAIRVARGFTGRDWIIKFEGCYHGHADALLVKAGSGVATFGLPSSAGVPQGATANTLALPYNDVDAVREAFARLPEQIAAVIVEPVVGNMGCVPPRPGFLEGLRRLTRENGALLIFDEVMTGFRLARGGASERYGIHADLITLGKIIGGGMPVGAYGGRADIMNCVAPLGAVYQAGTLSGNPLSMAAGQATLDEIQDQPGLYQRLEQVSEYLAQGLRAAAAEAGVPVAVQQVGSMLTVFFQASPVHDFEQASASNTAAFARFHHAMLERGVLLPPSQFEAAFVSASHSEPEAAATLAAAREAFREVAAG